MKLAHRTLAAALVGTLVLPACVVRGKYRTLGYVGNGALIAVGGTIAITEGTGCDLTPDGGACRNSGYQIRTQALIGGSLLVLGAVGLALQILGHDHAPTEADVADGGPPGTIPPVSRGDDVVSLSRRAIYEARLGHCAAAVDLGHQVFKLAPAYFENVLSHDRDMTGCL